MVNKSPLFLFSNQRIAVLIPSPTQHKNILQTAWLAEYLIDACRAKVCLGNCTKEYFEIAQFDGMIRRPDCDLAFLPARRKSAGSLRTHHGLCWTVSPWLQQLKWTDPIVHKSPASLAGRWTCKQHARGTPQRVLCDTELKSCLACQEH